MRKEYFLCAGGSQETRTGAHGHLDRPWLLGSDRFFQLFELSQQLNLMFRFTNTLLIASDEMRFVGPAYPDGFLGNRVGIPVSEQLAGCGPPPRSCFSVEGPPFSVFNHITLSGNRSVTGRRETSLHRQALHVPPLFTRCNPAPSLPSPGNVSASLQERCGVVALSSVHSGGVYYLKCKFKGQLSVCGMMRRRLSEVI